MTKKDGGPAFPGAVLPEHQNHPVGMSLRDYFAAKAMQGELAAQDARNDGKGTGVLTPDSMSEFAARCYATADAMLAEREK